MTLAGSNLRVLSVGNDPSLLYIREMVLKKGSHFVRTILSNELPACLEDKFDVAVLCHTIPLDRAESIARTLRARYPGIEIIRLSNQSYAHDASFDRECDPTYGPLPLLQLLEGVSASRVRTDPPGHTCDSALR